MQSSTIFQAHRKGKLFEILIPQTNYCYLFEGSLLRNPLLALGIPLRIHFTILEYAYLDIAGLKSLSIGCLSSTVNGIAYIKH